MFQEAIASTTAAHLRIHIGDLLEEIGSRFTGRDSLTLSVPTIDSVTLVGGIMTAPVEALPLLGVDCVEKEEIPSSESLCYYQYSGAVAGLVSASSSDEVDRLIKRYAAVTELFIRRHQYLVNHSTGQQYQTQDFMIREFLYGGTGFSGAMEVRLEDEQPLWVDGFTIPVAWYTSEDQYHQHT